MRTTETGDIHVGLYVHNFLFAEKFSSYKVKILPPSNFWNSLGNATHLVQADATSCSTF
jgi:hypothetical protein